MTVVIARGLKVNREVLNKLLSVNKVNRIEGDHISKTEEDNIATFFRGNGVIWAVKIFIPAVVGFDPSPYIYICDKWEFVTSQQKVNVKLGPIVAGMDDIRHVLGVESPVSSYVLVCNSLPWTSPAVVGRLEPPITCDVCQQAFTAESRQAWKDRQEHKRQAHGSKEGDWPLPDAI